MRFVGPVVVAFVFVGAMSFIRDDGLRLRINAVIPIGASGTYIASGAFGPLELLFSAVVLIVAYRGFRAWRWVGIAWLLHTGLDIAHAAQGVELLPWATYSALGCAICDPVIALWCFAGGQPIDKIFRRLRPDAVVPAEERS